MALRRKRRKPSVVPLVIFILLFLISTGVAVWLYHQLALVKKAIQENQYAFGGTVATFFANKNWPLPQKSEPGELGVRYDRDTYRVVTERVERAAKYDEVLELLQWKTIGGIQAVLEDSPVQIERGQEGEPAYSSIAGLLFFYEDNYTKMNDLVAEQKTEIENLRKQLDAKSKQVVDTERSLRESLNKANREYAEDMRSQQQKYNQLLATYEKQKSEAEQWHQKYTRATQEHKVGARKLEQERTRWREMYEATQRGKPPEEAPEPGFRPVGKVLTVQPTLQAAIVETGDDTGRARNDRLVVYRVDPEGKRHLKGILNVTKVFDHTSLASVIREDERIQDGDLFAMEAVWVEFEGTIQEQ